MKEKEYLFFPKDIVADKFIYNIEPLPGGLIEIFVSLEICGKPCYYRRHLDRDTWYAYPKIQQLEILEEIKRVFLKKVFKAILPNPKVEFKYERQRFYTDGYYPSPSEPPEGLFDLLKIGDSK